MARARLILSLGFAAFLAAGSASAQPSQSSWADPLSAPADSIAYLNQRDAAFAALAAEDYPRAEPLFEELTTAYEQDAETWWGLAVAKRFLNKPGEAISAYARVIALAGPTYRRARFRTVVLQLNAGDVAGALASLDQLVFTDAYLERPDLMANADFAALRDNARFQDIAGAIDTSELNRVTGWRLDLDFLLAEIHRLNPDYRTSPLPTELTDLHRELHDNVASLTDEQMFAGLSRLIGALDMNHTQMWGISSDAVHPTLSYLPLQFYFFPEGVFIVGADAAHAELIGAELLAIDETPTDSAFTRVRTAMSAGSESEALWQGPLRLADLSLLNGLGLSRRGDRTELRLQLRTGRIVSRAVRGTPTPLYGKLPAPPRVEAPLFLRNATDSHWFETWTDGTIYAQVNQIAPDRDESLDEFGLRLRSAVADGASRNIVLDLRHNNGGDTTTYVELLRTLVVFSARDGNQLYVMIGRNTYSAAANLVTDLERLAGPIFVGEPSAATGNQDGDEGRFRLPYSGLRGTISAVRWQLGYPFDARRFIAPDAPVQLTAADYFAGRDPALAVIRSLITEQTRRESP